MPSTIFWRRNVYGDNTIYTPLTLHCYLACLTTCTANFLFLSSKFGIIVGCRLISYSFYQQIHGGDIRPYSFNLLVFLVAEGANLLFVEISKALCCGSATVNLNQIPNLRHCFNFFLLKYNLVQIQRRLSLDHIAIRPARLLRSGPLELTA